MKQRCRSRPTRLPAIAAIWLSMLCGGCSSQSGPQWYRDIFFGKADVDPRGTLAAHEQMKQLQALREEMPTLAAEVQQAKAMELAQRYRNESDAILRAQIVRTIALCGSPAAGETLAAALGDSDRDIRITACDGWAQHGGPQATPTLAATLRHDKSMDVRLAAARALGKLSGPDVVAALAPALDDTDPALQYRAVQSLRSATGKDFGDSVGPWREFVRGGTPSEISTAQRMKLNYF